MFVASLEVSRHLATAVVPPPSISIDVARMGRIFSAVAECSQIVKAHLKQAEEPGQCHWVLVCHRSRGCSVDLSERHSSETASRPTNRSAELPYNPPLTGELNSPDIALCGTTCWGWGANISGCSVSSRNGFRDRGLSGGAD